MPQPQQCNKVKESISDWWSSRIRYLRHRLGPLMTDEVETLMTDMYQMETSETPDHFGFLSEQKKTSWDVRFQENETSHERASVDIGSLIRHRPG